MKRLIVAVLMLIVGLSLVDIAEAFCVFNETEKKIKVNVKVITPNQSGIDPIGIPPHEKREVKQKFDFNVDPRRQHCKSGILIYPNSQVKTIVVDASSNESLCSVEGSSMSLRVTVKDNTYSCIYDR